MENAPYLDITSQDELADVLETQDGRCVVLDMWAPWCGPCLAMAPHFEAVARAYEDDPIVFAKINTEDHPELSALFGVKALPTTLLLHEGKIADIIPGMLSGPQLAKRVEWLLSKERGDGLLKRLFKKPKPLTSS